MTLKELRAKKGLTQFEAAAIAAQKVHMNHVKWSILESLDVDFIKALEKVFGEQLEIPAGVKHD